MNPKRQELIELFAAGYDQVRVALKELPEEMWKWKPAPDKWSVHEICIHLPDSEASGFVRLRKILAEPECTVGVYDQEAFADKLDYHGQDMNLALDLFGLMRKSSADILRKLPDDAWSMWVHHPERGTMSLDFWLEVYASHVPGHVKQMKRNLAEWEATGRPKA